MLAQLSRHNIKAQHNDSAVYALRHTPTGMLYFGSTATYRTRLRNWYYSLESPHSTGFVTRAMSNLLGRVGCAPSDWAFAFLRPVPEGANLRHGLKGRPEWPHVQHLISRCPSLVLNDLPGQSKKPTFSMRAKGKAPLTQLTARFNRAKGVTAKFDLSPLAAFRCQIDAHKLVAPPGLSTSRPFWEYLFRIMRTMGIKNPTGPAIQGLYFHWRRYQDRRDPVWDHPPPSTINDALRVPAPVPLQHLPEPGIDLDEIDKLLSGDVSFVGVAV